MKAKFLLTSLLGILILAACVPSATPLADTVAPVDATQLSSLEPVFTATPAMTVSFSEAPCPVKLPQEVVEGEHISCGYVDVPERWSSGEPGQPSGDSGHRPTTIRLAVAVIASTSDDPALDPLVMLAGGPGQSALEAFIPLLAVPGMDDLYEDRDIILIEQRGTQHSTPFLSCQEMTEIKMDILNQDLGDEEEEALKLEAWNACKDRLVAEGVNLEAYNSLESSADIIAIVDALGYGKINLYGGSYGSLLAQYIMRDYPDRVRSAVLDGVSPLRHEPNLLYKAHSTDRALRMLFAKCEEDEECKQLYPDLEKVYFDLVDRLNEQPAELQVTNPETGEVHNLLLTGDRLVIYTRDLLYITNILPDLPGAIYNMTQGDFTLLELVQATNLFRVKLADGLYNSVVCSELADFSASDMADTSDLYPKVAEVVEDLIDEVMLQPCKVWGVDHLGDKASESAAGDIPTLLLSGEFDPTVPPSMAQVAAEKLTNAYLYTFPGAGHYLLGSEECATTMISTFLDNPSQAPEVQCFNELPGLVFRFPLEGIKLEEFSDDEIGLRGLVPSGWKEVRPGTFARGNSATDPAALQMILESQKDPDMILSEISNAFGQAEPPNPTSEHKANGLSWSLYTFDVQGYPIFLGLSQSEGGVLILIVQSSADEGEEFYEEIFLPILEALVLL